MSRFAMPFVVLASLIVVVGCAQTTASSAPSAAVAATSPTVDLRLAHSDPGAPFPDTGPFVSDPSATVNTCAKLDDGFWKVSYSGGQPYVRVESCWWHRRPSRQDRPRTYRPTIRHREPADDTAELRPAGLPLRDARGRSKAVVKTTSSADAITFDVAATTPRAKVDFTDYPYTVDVDLTVTCPTTPS